MLMRRLALPIALAGLLNGCSNSPVTITPPRIRQGGRALSIAVMPNNQQRLLVTTESGGCSARSMAARDGSTWGDGRKVLTLSFEVEPMANNGQEWLYSNSGFFRREPMATERDLRHLPSFFRLGESENVSVNSFAFSAATRALVRCNHGSRSGAHCQAWSRRTRRPGRSR